ncbi:Stf0 family sulfotransferase [Sphingomonas sp. LB-2]|uniref:Stf0 family sulfotransferase n=1 Tax=Sphingomonas caeni TaxID=2984949 RepID=UPI0022324DEC|nr:Stf0 family sulfotransferase [Sphingomonas caeni]MCW3846654.1 Stf0 family sulfotransferase [Sphingomonas caeni]
MSDSDPAGPAARPYDLTTAAHDYPARDDAPTRTILLCTHPRSGSTLLGEALYFAGGLGCPLEYFHAGFRPSFARRWDAPDIGRLSAAVRRHRTEPNGTMAVKLFWRDIEEIARESDPALADLANVPPGDAPADYYRALAEHVERLFPNPVFVHLWREDRLRQAISAVVAVDTGRWRLIPGVEGQAPIGMPEFDVERIERIMSYSDYCHGHFRNLFAAMGVTPYPISYEALTTDYTASVAGVLAWLGSTAEPMAPRMQRQADLESEALVLRYLREHALSAGGPAR